MITSDDVKKLAQLARIELTSAEEAKLGQDMESILNYVSELQKLEIPAGDESVSTALIENVMREDVEPYDPGVYTDNLLAEAPARAGNFVKVKQIL